MDESVSDPGSSQGSTPDERILEQSKFGASSASMDPFDKRGPWIGKIFLSYSSPDRTRTNGIRKLLEGMGHQVFHDHESIKAGTKWRSALATALEQADCLALFWTRHARKSTWVREEYETFTKMKPGNPLIPIYGDPGVSLPPLLSEHQVVDLGYAPDKDEPEKKQGAGALLWAGGRSAVELGKEINGSIDLALGMADKLRKAGKSAPAVVQGVVSALRERGYPVPNPSSLEEGLRVLGGFGWLRRLAATPLEPLAKPARWTAERVLQATPAAATGAVAGAAAAVLIGTLLAPALEDVACWPVRQLGGPGALVDRCAPLSQADDEITGRNPIINNTYYTSTPEVFPYTFEREFRSLQERTDLMLVLLDSLARRGPAGDDVAWPYWRTGSNPVDWSVLLDRWESDERVRWQALVAILEANQAQTDTILGALAAAHDPPIAIASPDDYRPLLQALLQGLDVQGRRLRAIEDHLERLRLGNAGPVGGAAIANSGLGDLILRIEQASPPGSPVQATRTEVHYLLLPYTIGVIPPGIMSEGDDGLDDLRRRVRGEGEDGSVALSPAQARVLLLPYRSGAVSALGMQRGALAGLIQELHRFLLLPAAGPRFTGTVPADVAAQLILPYRIDPLPPGLDPEPVRRAVDDIRSQLGLMGGAVEPDRPGSTDPVVAAAVERGANDVDLSLTPDEIRRLIWPHLVASPAAFLETFRARPDRSAARDDEADGDGDSGGDGGDAESDVDLGPLIDLQRRTHDEVMALGDRIAGNGPAPDGGSRPVDDWAGRLEEMASGQAALRRSVDSLLALMANRGEGLSARTTVSADPQTDLSGPGPLRYVRPRGDGVFQAPVPLDTLPPAYPEQARIERLEGIVDVEAMILTNGEVEVIRTAAASGLQILEAAARTRVDEWTFEAGRLDGQPIEVPLRVALTFELAPRPVEPRRP